MDIILRLKKVRRFTRSALLPVLLFFAAEIGAQAQDYSMSVGDDFGAVVESWPSGFFPFRLFGALCRLSRCLWHGLQCGVGALFELRRD